MFFLKDKASRITSLLKTFQWFPIMLCIKAKLLINARKAPAYVSSPTPNQSLLSTVYLPHWPSFCSANTPCSFLPESPGCSLCLEGSSLSPYAWLLLVIQVSAYMGTHLIPSLK